MAPHCTCKVHPEVLLSPSFSICLVRYIMHEKVAHALFPKKLMLDAFLESGRTIAKAQLSKLKAYISVSQYAKNKKGLSFRGSQTLFQIMDRTVHF